MLVSITEFSCLVTEKDYSNRVLLALQYPGTCGHADGRRAVRAPRPTSCRGRWLGGSGGRPHPGRWMDVGGIGVLCRPCAKIQAGVRHSGHRVPTCGRDRVLRDKAGQGGFLKADLRDPSGGDGAG